MAEPTIDKELETAVARAQKLRITMKEIQDATGIAESVLWRWRNGTKPNWERRQHTIKVINELIDKAKKDYEEV